jgi:hypothetical protein
MTKKQIIERLKAAGVKGWDKLNSSQLEALAAENGVSLGEPAEEGSATPTDVDGLRQDAAATGEPSGERAVTSAPTEVAPPVSDREKAEAMLTNAGHPLDLLLFEEDGGKFGIAVAVNTTINGVADSWEDAARELLEDIESSKLKAAASDGSKEAPTGEPHSESADHDGLSRLITPQMACSVFPGPGEASDD